MPGSGSHRKPLRRYAPSPSRCFVTPEAEYEWSRDVTLSGPTPGDHPGYRALKMKFHDENAFDLFRRLLELRGYARPMLGDERLIALLDDEEVFSALDRYIEHRDPDDYATVLDALIRVRIRSPRVFELARTWVASFVKAQKGESLSQPKKVVFHWRSLGNPRWLQLYMIALEEPDPVVSVFDDDDLEDYADTPEDERQDEDRIVIFFDGVDVRKKVFYAPFEEWSSLKLGP